MNLETLKNTYAQEQGYEDWDNYVIKHFVSSKYSMTATLSVFENHMDKICIRAQKAALEKQKEIFISTIEERINTLHKQSLNKKGKEKIPYESAVTSFVVFKMHTQDLSITNEQNLIR